MPTLIRPPIRKFRSYIMDSTRWRHFVPRKDDIIICVHRKAGTTWTQRIVDLLVHQSPEPRQVMSVSPWLEHSMKPIEEVLTFLDEQKQRRYIKTHLPLDALPLFDSVKYIHTSRDARDVCMSDHNHFLSITSELRHKFNQAADDDPRIQRMPPVIEDPREFFLEWLAFEESYKPGMFGVSESYFDLENTYWHERKRKNFLFVHFNDLKKGLAGEMQRIADFLDIDTPEPLMRELVNAATFETMKSQGKKVLFANIDTTFERGADSLLYKGTSNRWREVLTSEDLARYDVLVQHKMSPSLASWASQGRLVAGDPKDLPD